MDHLGVGDAILHDAVTARGAPLLPWQATCWRVRAIALRLRGSMHDDSFKPLVVELLARMDDGDPLVAFLALEVLCDSLGHLHDPSTVHKCVRLILQPPSSSDTTTRFQLLRQLIRTRKSNEIQQTESISTETSDDDETEEKQDLNDEDEVEESCRVARDVFLASVLENMALYEAMLSIAMEDPTKCHSAVHAGLVCLTDIVKRSSSLTHQIRNDLCHVFQRTLERSFAWPFSNGAVPTFIACDLVDLAMDSRSLYQQLSSVDASWVTITFTMLQSPLSTFAMNLLQDDSVSSDNACAESFVAMTSRYPLVQKWIQLCCVTATAALERPISTYSADWDWATRFAKLPTRTQLFTVLTEQDDILIDVVVELLTIARHLRTTTATVPVELLFYVESELQPDSVFAGLLQVFSDDHLVLLDMLMSSETRMLEYLLKYLRHVTESWPRSRLAWDRLNRTHSVMATLIRLRMEMERLVDASVFPYNPTPLLRRLEALEHQYENETS